MRRALGKKDATAAIATFRDDFLHGARSKGVSEETALLVFNKLLGFGSYSFPKSHAAAFAVVVYQSAWLRKYHPAAFYTALLNNQPMGFYAPSTVANDARRQGLRLLTVDVNLSMAACMAVDDPTIRLGFNYVKGVGEVAADAILSAQQDARFDSLLDFCQRTGLAQWQVENLIQSGALDALGASRRDLLWEVGRLRLDDTFALDTTEHVHLPEATRLALLNMEYDALGLSTHDHIMAVLREWLNEQRVLNSRSLAQVSSDSVVRCAGLVLIRQAPPTAKGFRFITLEDKWGFINVIVRPQVYDKYRKVIWQEQLLRVHGTLQREGDVLNVLATGIYPL
ncbi:MAG: OB-fold nucleic acid binding domain-containing protein [Chloroflexota bacterium]